MGTTANLPLHQVRADYDRTTIVVYQAYRAEIAEAAVRAQRFAEPFSLNRMTWIKPSFLWLMGRSNWARKPGQEHILAVRITREGWESALSQAVLTGYQRGVHADHADWEQQMKHATVYVQWDPERTLAGAVLDHDADQGRPEPPRRRGLRRQPGPPRSAISRRRCARWPS